MAKRPYSILQNQLAKNQKNPIADQRDKAALDAVKKSVLGRMHTVDADQSLKTMPSLIRRQLDEYLESPGATIKAFALSNKSFDFRLTTRKEPATFVELGTTNPLDCGLYEFGVRDRARIVVVNPRPGSTFNNGDPGIITFYGKGLKADRVSGGRNIISRWAVWTPQGIKDDFLVERLVTGDPLIDHDDDGVSGPSRKKRRTVTQDIDYSDDRSDGGLFITPEPEDNNTGVEDLDHSQQEQVVVNKDDENQTKEELGQDDTKLTVSPTGDNASSMPARPPFFPPRVNRTLHNHDRDHVIKSEPTPRVKLSSPTGTSITHDVKKYIKFSFRAQQDAAIKVEKAATHCDSVQKMFAYACKAGISNPSTVMLSAQFFNQTYQVVRDDESDFLELLRGVYDLRVLHDMDFVDVFVTPSTY